MSSNGVSYWRSTTGVSNASVRRGLHQRGDVLGASGRHPRGINYAQTEAGAELAGGLVGWRYLHALRHSLNTHRCGSGAPRRMVVEASQ